MGVLVPLAVLLPGIMHGREFKHCDRLSGFSMGQSLLRGIPLKALKLLEEMNIPSDQIQNIGYEINNMDLYTPGGIQPKYSNEKPQIRTKSFRIRRNYFDNMLWRRVRKTGVHAPDGLSLKNLNYQHRRCTLELEHV
ncbi:MAG: hypothetical protein P8184_15455 [Calditrichia bacterium]